MRIVLICDENYVVPTEVMIKSICESTRKYGGTFIISVCSWKLSDTSIEHIQSYTDSNVQVQVVLVDSTKYQERMFKINQNSHVTPTALIKFELANLFPQDSKILYLDSDMIVKGNLNELTNISLGTNLVAASYEFWKYLLKKYQYIENQEMPEFYFNSGVMLLNAELFRKENISEKLWETKFEQFNVDMKGKFALMDQDVFNVVCRNRVTELPIRFNCNTRFTHDVNVDDINTVFHTDYLNIGQVKDDAIILHYVGKEDKPWKYVNVACQNIWDECYKLTGRSTEELNRIKPQHTIKHYWNKAVTSVINRGIVNSIRYGMDKLK